MQVRWFRPDNLKSFIARGTPSAWPGALLITLLMLPPSPAAPQTTPVPGVIQTETHVVLVNVIVKDKHGKPVEDLRRDDFVLLDNHQGQKIALFAREDASANATAFASLPGRLTFTNRPGSSAPAVTAFLFDELNTSLTDQEFAKKEFLHYLRELPADSRVAVFVLGDSLALLHDFSQDMASLLAAIEEHKNRVNPEVAAATAPPASANSLTGGVADTSQWDDFIRASNKPYVNYTETVRATRTAQALEIVAGHLEGIPGRKTLIWISGGFPIQLGLRGPKSDIPPGTPNTRPSSAPTRQGGGGGGGRGSGGAAVSAGGSGGGTSSTASNPGTSTPQIPGTDASFESNVARAIRALNEADVAVYPVDARGITTPTPFQADRNSMGKPGKAPRGTARPDFNYETLETLAEQTGGLAFHHLNDLSSAIHDAANDAQVSYSLAFYPSADGLDGSFHRLEVTVNRPNMKLRYRPGYVATPQTAVAPSLAEAIANPISLAGIGFNVHLDPVEGGYKSSITIDPRNITLEPKDGKWTGAIQFVVVVGKVEQLTTIPLNFTEAVYRQIQDKGLILGARVKTPPGTTGFSLGFRDIPSGMVGTLHVPL
jgi:VWFA-related protein